LPRSARAGRCDCDGALVADDAPAAVRAALDGQYLLPGRECGGPGGDVDQGEVEEPAASGPPMAEDRNGRVETGERIGDRIGTEAGARLLPLGGAPDRGKRPGEPGRHGGIVTEGDPIAPWPVAPIARDRGPDPSGPGADPARGVVAELLQSAGARALEHDVGVLEQRLEEAAIARLPEIERARALSAIE